MGDGTKRKKLVYVNMVYYQLRGLYTFLVSGDGNISIPSIRKKNMCNFSSQFYVQIKCGKEIYMHLCIHTKPNYDFYVVEENKYVKYFI